MASYYEYKIGRMGPKKRVQVFKDNSPIWTGEWSSAASESLLIEEAKLALGVSDMQIYGTHAEEEAAAAEEEKKKKEEEAQAQKDAAEAEKAEAAEKKRKAEEEKKKKEQQSKQAQSGDADYQFAPDANSQAPSNGGSDEQSAKPKYRVREVFPKTIELDELSIEAPEVPEGSDHVHKPEEVLSLQYPMIKINDYLISSDEIDNVVIDSNGFLPTISLSCTFMRNTFLVAEMPKDGDIISFALRNKSDVLKSIRNDYVITSVVVSKTYIDNKGPVTMTFFGQLFIPGLASGALNISHLGTSFEAMKDLADLGGLGFATNEDNTEDKQIWMSGMDTVFNYIDSTISRAWKDETSFYDIWIDVYYNLNFVNVDKQLMSGEDETDLAVFLDNIDTELVFGAHTSEDETVSAPKIFSNLEVFKRSSFYIDSWKPNNNATNVTFDVGTKINCNLFEHNANVYQNTDAEKYWSVPIEPTYDPDKVNSHILLRGRATQDPENRGNDAARANYTYSDIYIKNPWMGIQYSISDSTESNNNEWDGNHHPNYNRAKVQNTINNKELDKLNVIISVTGLNLNIIKGDKVPIAIINSDSVSNKMVNPENDGDDALDLFYSGWYYVKGFKIKYEKKIKPSMFSNITQTFILSRREWPPPLAVDPITNTEN